MYLGKFKRNVYLQAYYLFHMHFLKNKYVINIYERCKLLQMIFCKQFEGIGILKSRKLYLLLFLFSSNFWKRENYKKRKRKRQAWRLLLKGETFFQCQLCKETCLRWFDASNVHLHLGCNRCNAFGGAFE